MFNRPRYEINLRTRRTCRPKGTSVATTYKFSEVLRKSANAIPRTSRISTLNASRGDERDDGDHLLEMDVLRTNSKEDILKYEIRDLKQLLHIRTQTISKMEDRETKLKKAYTDEICELKLKNDQLNSDLQESQKITKQYNDVYAAWKQKLQQQETRLEEYLQRLESKKTENTKLQELLQQAIQNSKTTEVEKQKLQSDISELNRSISNLKQRAATLLAENENLKEENMRQKLSLKTESADNPHEKCDAKQQTYSLSELHDISEDSRNKDNQIVELRTKLEHIEKQFNETRRNDEQKIHDLETEKSEQALGYDSQVSTLKQKITDPEKRVQELSKENNTLKGLPKKSERRSPDGLIKKNRIIMTEKDLEGTKARYTQDKLNMESDLATLRSQLKDVQKSQLQTRQNEEETVNTHKQSNVDSSRIHKNVSSLKTLFESICKENENGKPQKKLLFSKNRTKKETRQADTKARMGDGGEKEKEEVGNNQVVAELSDAYRPTKLAEKFKDLFDDHWSVAYEALEELQMDRKQIQEMLLQIILHTKQFCDKESKQQLEDTTNVITQTEEMRKRGIPKDVMKYINHCRKESLSETNEKIYMKCYKWVKTCSVASPKYIDVPEVVRYTKECFNICWLNAIQDNPVVFAPKPAHDDPLDGRLYTTHTGTDNGTAVDYLVWPALMTHDNETVLAKGVVMVLEPSFGEVSGRRKSDSKV